MKIRYIEIKPVRQTLEFEDREKWNEFHNNRIKEIIDYIWSDLNKKGLTYNEYYQYTRVLLNGDGTPRKPITAKWLHTKKAHEKQRKNWLIYLEKKKKETFLRNIHKNLAEIDFKIKCLNEEREKLIEIRDFPTCDKCGKKNEFVRFEGTEEKNICDSCLNKLKEKRK
jgi:formylmethanofuran dehydrogenase subunit E